MSFLQADPELQEVSRALAGGVFDNSADLLSWFLPPGWNPLWESVTAGLYQQFTTPNLMETTLFFGFLPILLATTSVFVRWHGRRQVIFWQMLALSTWILSFGPILHVLGRPVMGWMPYRLLMELPGFYAFRIPSRIGITAILAMTVLAMMVLGLWVEKHPRWPWRVILVVCSGLLLLNMAFVFPYKTSSTTIPPVYHRVADTPGEFAILELPAGELFFGNMSWYMYYQTYHQKHLVSGYLGRRPARLHSVERTLPFVKRFFTNDRSRLVDYPTDEQILQQEWPEDVQRANTLLDDQDIRYVILHCPSMQGAFCEPASALLTAGLGPPDYVDGTTMRFEVSPGITSFPDVQGEVVTSYDDTFSEPFVREGRYTRTVSGTGAVTLSVPLRGQWSVYGELEGDIAEEVQLSIDGQVSPVRYVEYSETLRTFSLEEDLEPGLHSLVIQLPSNHMTGEEQDCDSLFIRNLTVRLNRPMGVELETAQNFGDMISLNSYSVQELHVSNEEDPVFVLATRWYCRDPIADDYTLYVHYVDSSGERLAQDDHLLGRALVDPTLPTSQWLCPGVQYDISYIPRELVEPGTMEVALGLWLPETGYHLQPSGELRVDEFGRSRLDVRLEEQ
jgi:uncharacterized membrane protein